MEENIEELEKKLKRLKLEKQLAKLGVGKKEEKKEEPKVSEESKIKKEIAELEEKKKGQKGITGFIRKLAINRKINETRALAERPKQITALKQGIEINKLRAEYNKTKKEAQTTNPFNLAPHAPVKFIDTKEIFG